MGVQQESNSALPERYTEKYAVQQELVSIRQLAAERYPLTEAKIPLATYLSKLSMLGRASDGVQLDALKRANDSVNKTRDIISYGKGNCAKNLKGGHEPNWRVEFLRNKMDVSFLELDGLQNAIVPILKMQAGNCGEFSFVTTAVHAEVLKKGEEVARVVSDSIDHAWCESFTVDNEKIVLDSWAVGPTILGQDARFNDPIELGSFNETYPNYFQQCQDNLKNLDNTKIDSEWMEYKLACQTEGYKLSRDKQWLPTPVMSKQFIDESNQVKTILDKMDITDSVNLKKEETQRINVNDEIRAIGAARALGTNIKQGVDVVDKINKYYLPV